MMGLDPTSPRNCRLLTLSPGKKSDAIQCHLSLASLDQSLDFEALSYVWGDVKDTLTICLDGEEKLVTRNLESALRHLRYHDCSRVLWIDAVCINQEDDIEKSHQIKFMGQIYSEAKSVVVWLGQSAEIDEVAIPLIKTIANGPDSHWTQVPANSSFHLMIFFKSDWWYRVWTVQEAVLAQNLTYYCGDLVIEGVEMMTMLQRLSKHLRGCCINILHAWGKELSIEISELLAMSVRLETIESYLADRCANQPFYQVASDFRDRFATDPRDKVYGLLGISTDSSDVTINYNSSVAQTYELYTRENLESSRCLDLLSHKIQVAPGQSDNEEASYWRRTRDSATPNLPTWVPDWDLDFDLFTRPLTVLKAHIKNLHLFDSCGSRPFQASSNDEPGCLQVSGILVETIERVSKPCLLGMNEFPGAIIREWRTMAGIESEPDKSYPSGGTIIDAFWRTLCSDLTAGSSRDMTYVWKRADPDDRTAHDREWYLMSSFLHLRRYEDLEQLQGSPFTRVMRATILTKRFFITHNGYLGLAPESVQAGDMVCVLDGGRLPFILRGLGASSNDGHMVTCKMLGTAYLHGIMDGEALHMVTDGLRSFQTFKLV